MSDEDQHPYQPLIPWSAFPEAKTVEAPKGLAPMPPEHQQQYVAALRSLVIGNGNDVMFQRVCNGDFDDVVRLPRDEYSLRFDDKGQFSVLHKGSVLAQEDIPRHIIVSTPNAKETSMGLFERFYFGDIHYGIRPTPTRFYEPVPEQMDHPETELREKQQRSAVQSKRHKRRRIHLQDKKDVPDILKRFVNKATG